METITIATKEGYPVIMDFELFEKVFNIRVRKIFVSCLKCDKEFTITLKGERNINEVPKSKVKCYECLEKENKQLTGVI